MRLWVKRRSKTLTAQDTHDCQVLRSGTDAEVGRVLGQFRSDAKLRDFLWQQLIRPSGSRAAADDLNDLWQETLAALWAYVRSGRFRGDCSLRTLFRRIATRRWIDWQRKQGRYVSLDPALLEELEASGSLDLPDAGRAEALRKTFEAWADGGHCGALLRAWAEKEGTYDAIEQRFGFETGTGRKKVDACKGRLRRWLEQQPAYLHLLNEFRR